MTSENTEQPSEPVDERTFGDVGTTLLVDNEQVRVWELHLEPGQTSDLHSHEHDYVMVQIEGDAIAARFEPDTVGTFAGSDYLEGPVIPGLAIFAEAGGRETAVNIGETSFREVVVEVKAQRTPGMLAVQHISLNVTNVEEALPFYLDALGFTQLPRPDFGFPGAWLSTGNGIQIHLIEDPNFVAPSGPHTAFETSDIEAESARLKSFGVEVGDSFEMFGNRQAFFSDPSGNQFELNQPGLNQPELNQPELNQPG